MNFLVVKLMFVNHLKQKVCQCFKYDILNPIYTRIDDKNVMLINIAYRQSNVYMCFETICFY